MGEWQQVLGWAALGLVAGSWGCSGAFSSSDGSSAGGAAGADGGADGGAAGALLGSAGAGAAGAVTQPDTISIFLTGDLNTKSYADNLAGQTPTEYFVAISKYYLLTSAHDPEPVLCFERAAPIEADLHEDNLMGSCSTSSVPSAEYTHGRVRVDWLRYTVGGTLHAEGSSVASDIAFFRAFSDTTYNGESFDANQGTATLSGPLSYSFPMTYNAISDVPGIEIELVDGELWMTFPYSRPLVINQQEVEPHWARMHWEIFDAFRWEEKDTSGYEAGSWDVSAVMDESEVVVVPGVSGYHVTASTD